MWTKRRIYSRYRVIAWWIAACLVFIFLTGQRVYAEWPEQSCSFRHRIPVTVMAGVSGHSDEIRIDLTSADIPASYVFSAAGNDLRVFESDDLIPLDYVVTGWDAVARTATIYIRLSALAGGASETVYIYLGDESLPSGDVPTSVFPNVGVQLRSRVSTADPISPADGRAAFAAATVDVTNSVRPTVSGINNRAVGGTNGNYGWCVSAVLNVTAATAGVWGFRYGADFGRGGHLFVRGQQLEEDWNDDLWWANNYANTGETLEGTINLPEGWHRYEALGFEGCCDGPIGFQARAPGGAWLDLGPANFPLRAAQCVNTSVSVASASSESCSTTLDAVKTLEIDPSSASPYFIPGAIVRYNLQVENPGQIVDPGTIALTDIFPPDVSLMTSGPGVFDFADGVIPSGLGFVYGGPTDVSDNVEFSIDGSDFTHSPTAPYDDTVTHIRLSPTGVFNPNDSGDKPSFTIRVLGRLE